MNLKDSCKLFSDEYENYTEGIKPAFILSRPLLLKKYEANLTSWNVSSEESITY